MVGILSPPHFCFVSSEMGKMSSSLAEGPKLQPRPARGHVFYPAEKVLCVAEKEVHRKRKGRDGVEAQGREALPGIVVPSAGYGCLWSSLKFSQVCPFYLSSLWTNEECGEGSVALEIDSRALDTPGKCYTSELCTKRSFYLFLCRQGLTKLPSLALNSLCSPGLSWICSPALDPQRNWDWDYHQGGLHSFLLWMFVEVNFSWLVRQNGSHLD